jgi:hypothetical protein
MILIWQIFGKSGTHAMLCQKLLLALETQAVRKVQWPPSPVAKLCFRGNFRVFQDAK